MDEHEHNEQMEEVHRLVKVIESQNRSLSRQFTSGVISGIGSLIGVIVALYLALILIPPLRNVPVLGNLIKRISPTIEQQASQRIPNASSFIHDDSSSSTSSSTNGTSSSSSSTTVNGKTKLSNDYFTLTLPSGWSNVDVHESSSSGLNVDAKSTSTDGATFEITVNSGEVAAPIEALETESMVVNGITGTMYRYTDGKTGETEFRSLYLTHRDFVYILTLSYKPASYPNSAAVLDDILHGFSFAN